MMDRAPVGTITGTLKSHTNGSLLGEMTDGGAMNAHIAIPAGPRDADMTGSLTHDADGRWLGTLPVTVGGQNTGSIKLIFYQYDSNQQRRIVGSWQGTAIDEDTGDRAYDLVTVSPSGSGYMFVLKRYTDSAHTAESMSLEMQLPSNGELSGGDPQAGDMNHMAFKMLPDGRALFVGRAEYLSVGADLEMTDAEVFTRVQ